MSVRVWSFLNGVAKLILFLAKTHRKMLYFLNRRNDELVKFGHGLRNKVFKFWPTINLSLTQPNKNSITELTQLQIPKLSPPQNKKINPVQKQFFTQDTKIESFIN
jgi:hypothetical protein